MKIHTFEIRAKLPSLNEVIGANRTNRYMGAKFKRDIEDLIGMEIRQAQTVGTLEPVKNPCIIRITWNESTKKRDVDNIQSSQKCICDSLVKCGIVKDDSRRYVKQIYHQIEDAEKDSVLVTIEED